MKRHRVVLIYSDANLVRAMISRLGNACYEFFTAASFEQVRILARTCEAECVIADLEAMTLSQVKALQWEYNLEVICVHRNASDSMWVEALNAGAVDCCYPDDCAAINRALHAGSSVRQRSLAAAA